MTSCAHFSVSRGVRWCFTVCIILVSLFVSGPTAVAQPVWSKNLVYNPSFEEATSMIPLGWSRRIGARQEGAETYSVVAVDGKVIHSGKRSLSLFGGVGTKRWHALESEVIRIEAGQWYKLSGWMRTTSVWPEGDQFFNSNLYIQFRDEAGEIVNFMQSPVATTDRVTGTSAWTKVERVFKAPDKAYQARVGCVLTCTGSAWFDDISLTERTDINWQRVESDRIVFLYSGTFGPSEQVIRAQEDHLRYIEKSLGLTYEGKIRYYAYASKDRKERLTGNKRNSHYETGEVHALSWDDKHEIVHVVMGPLGPANPFLAEGIAVHLAGPWMTSDVHEFTRSVARTSGLPATKRLLSPSNFNAYPAELGYPQAGSFVRFLVGEKGMSRFMALYRAPKPNESTTELLKRFDTIFGEDLQTIDKAWLDMLLPPSAATP